MHDDGIYSATKKTGEGKIESFLFISFTVIASKGIKKEYFRKNMNNSEQAVIRIYFVHADFQKQREFVNC